MRNDAVLGPTLSHEPDGPASHSGRWKLRPWRLVSDTIAGKIVVPYLLLVFLLAALATYITIDLTAGSLEELFREELVGAGRSANEAMVALEMDHLTVLRQMTYTDGVAEAISSRDRTKLHRLLAPIAANTSARYVDVYGADGSELLTLRDPELGPNAESQIDALATSWAPVRRALAGDVDGLGERHADIVFAPWGPLLVTAGPVAAEGYSVGVITIATPIEEVAARLSREAGSKGITLYAKDGRLLTSTLRYAPEALRAALVTPGDRFDTVATGNRVHIRRATLDDRPVVEVLGALAVRRQPTLLIGVGQLITLIEESGRRSRNAMTALFGGILVLVLAIGLLLSHRIAGPVKMLVDAAARIRANDLELDLPVRSRDETGILTQAFNEMSGGLRERERSRVAIEKYMSPRVYELIQRGGLKIGGESREITVLVSDIRDFTGLAESLDADELLVLLNRYFESMFQPITRYDGEVDKYLGDGILAKFGATDWYPDHARRAVLAAVDMLSACELLSTELQREGRPPLHMGIGANSGPAIVGNIGAAERMEYTIISDAVNSADRIGALCKELGWDLLISYETYRQTASAIEVGEPWTVRLRGQSRDTLIYPVLGQAGSVPDARRKRYDDLLASRPDKPAVDIAARATAAAARAVRRSRA